MMVGAGAFAKHSSVNDGQRARNENVIDRSGKSFDHDVGVQSLAILYVRPIERAHCPDKKPGSQRSVGNFEGKDTVSDYVVFAQDHEKCPLFSTRKKAVDFRLRDDVVRQFPQPGEEFLRNLLKAQDIEIQCLNKLERAPELAVLKENIPRIDFHTIVYVQDRTLR